MFEADSFEVMPDVFYLDVPYPTLAKGTSSRSSEEVLAEIMQGSWHNQQIKTKKHGLQPMSQYWWEDTKEFATRKRQPKR